jgi:hypothetical protein
VYPYYNADCSFWQITVDQSKLLSLLCRFARGTLCRYWQFCVKRAFLSSESINLVRLLQYTLFFIIIIIKLSSKAMTTYYFHLCTCVRAAGHACGRVSRPCFSATAEDIWMKLGRWVEANICQTVFLNIFLYLEGQGHSGHICSEILKIHIKRTGQSLLMIHNVMIETYERHRFARSVSRSRSRVKVICVLVAKL